MGRAQHRRNQEAVEQADPGSIQTQVCRDPHREQEERGQEQQERGPRAQQRLCGLANPAWEAALRCRLLARAKTPQESSAGAEVERRTAQGQGEHGNLQQAGCVEEPAAANLAVRHLLQDGNEARQEEDVDDGGEPQEGGEKQVDQQSGSGSGGVEAVSDCAHMVQSSQTQDGPLQRAVELAQDLNQQTHVKPGELQAQDGEGASGKVEGADGEGQGGVNEGQRNTENPQEASGDVAPLEGKQDPVQPSLDSQTEQQGEDEQLHCVGARLPPGSLWLLLEESKTHRIRKA